jgi:hypothetical protein
MPGVTSGAGTAQSEHFFLASVKSCYIKLRYIISYDKKSLKISKGKSELVIRRTDNTIAKIKRTKGQTTIYNTGQNMTVL